MLRKICQDVLMMAAGRGGGGGGRGGSRGGTSGSRGGTSGSRGGTSGSRGGTSGSRGGTSGSRGGSKPGGSKPGGTSGSRPGGTTAGSRPGGSRDKAERDKAERDKAARDKAERDKAARDKAARDKAARDKAARDKAARDKAARDKAAREKAAREKAAREKAAREKAEREKAEREKAAQKPKPRPKPKPSGKRGLLGRLLDFIESFVTKRNKTVQSLAEKAIMDKQLQRVKELHALYDKSNKINHLTIDGRRIELGSESNSYGTGKVFNSQKLTDKQIHNYAQELAGNKKLEPVGPGIFKAKLGDGSSITLRDISSSKEISGARWTIDVRGNPDLKNLAMKYSSVEIKFK